MLNDMNIESIQVYACRRFAYDAIELYFKITDRSGKKFRVTNFEIEELDAGQFEIDYSPKNILVSDVSAKHLLDQLWQAGVRPSDDIASTGQLEAMKKHVETLQAQVENLQSVNDRLLAITEKASGKE